jgi:hypothetical protein
MVRHLGECEECRRLLAGLRAVVAGLGRLPAPAGGIGVTTIAASIRVRLHEPGEMSEPFPDVSGSNEA